MTYSSVYELFINWKRAIDRLVSEVMKSHVDINGGPVHTKKTRIHYYFKCLAEYGNISCQNK